MERYKKAPPFHITSRLLVVFSTYIYLAALYLSYDQYLYPIWEYWGFTLRPRSLLEVAFSVGMATCGAVVVPLRLRTGSSLIVALLFLFVYVPTQVVLFSLDVDRIEKYGSISISLALGFWLISYADRIKMRLDFRFIPLSWSSFRNSFGIAWFVFTVVLIYFFGSIMNFVGIEDIYLQRFARGDIDYPGLAYVQSIYIDCICAFFMAYGLVCRKWTLFLIGAAGCVLMYAVSAAKFVIALPFIYLTLDWLLKRSNGAGLMNWKIILSFSLLTIAITQSFDLGPFFSLVAALFSMRTIGIPALSIPQYYDLFSADGFTWWSHVKGFSLVVPIPSSFQGDPLWPSLGNIIGERVYANPDLQANANLWAGDGVAAAGALGVVVISLLLAIWIWLLEQSCRTWNRRFVILALLPFALSLTNAQFFTSLLSFGGIFWLVLFAVIRKNGTWPAEICASQNGVVAVVTRKI